MRRFGAMSGGAAATGAALLARIAGKNAAGEEPWE